MSSNSPSPAKTLLVLSLAALALVFSNCSTPRDGAPQTTSAKKYKGGINNEPPPAMSDISSLPDQPAIKSAGVDRKARIATQMTPEEVLQLARDCASTNRSNLQDFAVANVSLNLNLGLQTDFSPTKMTWVVSFRETGEKDGRASTDNDFWIYVDDTTHTAKFRQVPH